MGDPKTANTWTESHKHFVIKKDLKIKTNYGYSESVGKSTRFFKSWPHLDPWVTVSGLKWRIKTVTGEEAAMGRRFHWGGEAARWDVPSAALPGFAVAGGPCRVSGPILWSTKSNEQLTNQNNRKASTSRYPLPNCNEKNTHIFHAKRWQNPRFSPDLPIVLLGCPPRKHKSLRRPVLDSNSQSSVSTIPTGPKEPVKRMLRTDLVVQIRVQSVYYVICFLLVPWFQGKFWDDFRRNLFTVFRLVISHGLKNQICSVFSTIGFWRLIGIAAISVCKRQWDFQVGSSMPVFSMPKTNWDALISYQIFRLLGHRMRHICTWQFSA